MEDEDVIRSQMENTRTSLTEKLETLEQQVVQTAQAASSAVSETLTEVKESVQETVTAVKDTVQESVGAVKDLFDIPAHVQRRPWLMMGGAVALGFFLESIVERSSSRGHARFKHPNGHPRGKHKTARLPAHLLNELGPELAKLKKLALGAVMGTCREMIVQELPHNMENQLKEIIDGLTEKLGGEPLPDSDFERQHPGHEKVPRSRNGRATKKTK